MADAVILSQEMFDRIKMMLDDYEKGYRDSIQLGAGLAVEERGDRYVKIGFAATLQATVCNNGVAETHTFGVTQ